MSKPKILLAEDDMTMISLLKTLLKMEGFEVVTLDPEADVLAVIRSEKPDVLLLDVHLGKQNGLDILQKIRSTEDVKRTRVVMSSGANVKEECMSAGAFGFLMKPYMPDDLTTLLKQAMRSA
jgi:two-component system, NtrC family, response regulator AtoC